jgi:hypothetical protein
MVDDMLRLMRRAGGPVEWFEVELGGERQA